MALCALRSRLERGAAAEGVVDVVRWGSVEMLRLLLEYGGVADEAIQLAVETNDRERTALLLSYGADPNWHNELGSYVFQNRG